MNYVSERAAGSKNVRRGSSPVNILNIVIFVAFICLTVVTLYPFYLMIINSTYDTSTITSEVHFLPGEYLIDNYNMLMSNVDIWVGFKNSLYIACTATFLSIYFGTLTAYAFAKYKFKARNFMFWLILISMMIPPQLGLVGFFDICQRLGLSNNLNAFTLPGIASAYCVFFIKMYIEQSVPTSVVESARIDGAGEFKIFNRIVVPMVIPAMATMAIFHFITRWNDFLGPMVILTTADTKTLPIIISEARGLYGSELGAQFLAIAIAVVPVIDVFLFFSKYIISGITAGAEKG